MPQSYSPEDQASHDEPQPNTGSVGRSWYDEGADRRAVAQLLYQHGKPMSERYEDWASQHPIQNFAAEQGVNFALNEIPFARIIKTIPGGRNIGEMLETAGKLGQLGGWGEGGGGGGRQIAPEYRHPIKRKLNEELDQISDRDSYIAWKQSPDSTQGKMLNSYNQVLRSVATDLALGKRPRGPYHLTVARSDTRSGVVPGRPEYMTPETAAAARFNVVRGEENRGKPFDTPIDEINHVRQTHIHDVEFKKPLLYPMGMDVNETAAILQQQLKMTEPEWRKFAKLSNNILDVHDKYQGIPIERMTMEQRREMEAPMMAAERYLHRLAASRGHDVILKGGGHTIPEVLVVNPKVKKTRFSGKPGEPRMRDPAQVASQQDLPPRSERGRPEPESYGLHDDPYVPGVRAERRRQERDPYAGVKTNEELARILTERIKNEPTMSRAERRRQSREQAKTVDPESGYRTGTQDQMDWLLEQLRNARMGK